MGGKAGGQGGSPQQQQFGGYGGSNSFGGMNSGGGSYSSLGSPQPPQVSTGGNMWNQMAENPNAAYYRAQNPNMQPITRNDSRIGSADGYINPNDQPSQFSGRPPSMFAGGTPGFYGRGGGGTLGQATSPWGGSGALDAMRNRYRQRQLGGVTPPQVTTGGNPTPGGTNPYSAALRGG